MNSDTQFPATIPPFRYPVPPPDAEPDDGPLVQVCINFTWMAYILGALKSLMLQATWATDDPAVRELALQRTEFLLGMFMQASEGCGETVPGILCISGSFADDSYGYVPAIAVNCSADYVPGTGFTSCYDSVNHADVIQLIRPFNAATFIRSFEYTFTGTALASYTATATFFNAGVQVFQQQATFSAGGDGSLGGDVNENADLVLIELNHSTIVHDADLVLKTMSLCYTGAFPLSQSQTWTLDIPFGLGDGGFTPVVAGGITYAHYTGSEWYSGYEGQNSGQNYAQLQMYRVLTASGPFSVTLATIYVTCADDTQSQTATSSFVLIAAGSNSGSFIPENPLTDPSFGDGAFRLIVTNNDLAHVNRIHITRITLQGTGTKPS